LALAAARAALTLFEHASEFRRLDPGIQISTNVVRVLRMNWVRVKLR
jgi:hypothetical protein